MQEIQATEAKAHLAQLLNEVAKGASFSITRHGQRIAQLVPVGAQDQNIRKQAIDRFRKKRKNWQSAKMSVEEILAARDIGRRF